MATAVFELGRGFLRSFRRGWRRPGDHGLGVDNRHDLAGNFATLLQVLLFGRFTFSARSSAFAPTNSYSVTTATSAAALSSPGSGSPMAWDPKARFLVRLLEMLEMRFMVRQVGPDGDRLLYRQT